MALSTRNKVLSRLRSKLFALGSIIVSAAVVAGIMALTLYLIADILPTKVQSLLELLVSRDLEATRTGVIELFDDVGPGKVFVLFAIQVTQVLLAPIPGQITGFLMGILLGFWQGIVVAMSGIMVGSFIAMLIGRFFRNSVFSRIATKSVHGQFDYLISNGGAVGFFIVFLLPFSPDDAVAFVAGLARVNFAKLMLAAFLGRLPSTVALVYAGSSFGSLSIWAWVTLGIGIFLALVGWLFDREVSNFVSKFSSQPERQNAGNEG